MIRVGIVGCNYGCAVQLPAFRLDPRCQVVALAGSDLARTQERADQEGIGQTFAGWSEMIEHDCVDAVAIAAPPRLQPTIAVASLKLGKPVFVEKPMAADLAGAAAMLRYARNAPAMIDFSFTEVAAWRMAKAMLENHAIGRLRQISVNWHVENYATRARLRNWKTSGKDGGGALGNFASHSVHYLEWFGGPIVGLNARVSNVPDDPEVEAYVAASLAYQSGAFGSLVVSCASYLGSGHRLEFYGEDGTLVLQNTGTDYMRGFTLYHARRPANALAPIAIDEDPLDRKFRSDGRIAPVSRLVRRFLNAIERSDVAKPGLCEGYRAQVLLDVMRRSHSSGSWIDIEMDKAATA